MVDSLNDAITTGDFPRFEELLKDEEVLGEIINIDKKRYRERNIDKKRYTNRETPLTLAAQCCRSEFIQPLIDNGADVNECCITDHFEPGNTALGYACISEFHSESFDEERVLEVVKLLVKNGAKLDIGNSPLAAAIANGYKEIVKFLILEYKADANKVDDSWVNETHVDETPLFQACVKGDWEIFNLLVENGARLDEDSSDYSPFLVASKRGHAAIVRFFLESGAEVNQRFRDPFPVTALYSACESAYDLIGSEFGLIDTSETVALLLQHGADPYICTDDGQIAADIAADVVRKEKNPEILQLLRIHDYFARKEQGDDFKEEYEFRFKGEYEFQFGRETVTRKKLPAAQLKDIIHVMVKHPQHVEKFQTIFRENPDVIYWTDDKGRSVMHVACKAYHGVIKKGLVEASSLLDLLLWKLKIREISTTSTGVDRKKRRLTCGSDIVIPKVLEFLGIDLVKQKARVE